MYVSSSELLSCAIPLPCAVDTSSTFTAAVRENRVSDRIVYHLFCGWFLFVQPVERFFAHFENFLPLLVVALLAECCFGFEARQRCAHKDNEWCNERQFHSVFSFSRIVITSVARKDPSSPA